MEKFIRGPNFLRWQLSHPLPHTDPRDNQNRHSLQICACCGKSTPPRCSRQPVPGASTLCAAPHHREKLSVSQSQGKARTRGRHGEQKRSRGQAPKKVKVPLKAHADDAGQMFPGQISRSDFQVSCFQVSCFQVRCFKVRYFQTFPGLPTRTA